MRNVRHDDTTPPRLRLDLNMGTVWDLPPHSTGPQPGDDLWAAVKAAGYEGVQGAEVAAAKSHGFRVSGMGRVDEPGQAAEQAKRWADDGLDCGTVHVGSGYEDDDEALALLDACIEASETHGVPVYVELHRATITQDPWRTLQYVKRLPEVRFNADFSHWYTGGEMVYGDFDRRVAALAPVLERVRYVHGRISTPGQIQAVVASSAEPRPRHVNDFCTLWTTCCEGFLRDAAPGDVLPFAVELLPPAIFYALLDDDGVERGDRWAQATAHCELMTGCFAAAEAAVG